VKIIFAQGNPGTQYAKNRHNIGFIVVDTFADSKSVSFAAKSKFHSEIAELNIAGEKVLLVKPTTFYNETGKSMRAIMDFYKVDINDVLVVHDELVLPFGKIRIRQSGRDAGNNGIKSLNAHIGETYARLRIGVYNELRDRMHDADFVLGNFSQTEQGELKQFILPKALTLIDAFISNKLTDESFSTLPKSE
jgi:PTH1 family peptidyl-tRNA hydrolase